MIPASKIDPLISCCVSSGSRVKTVIDSIIPERREQSNFHRRSDVLRETDRIGIDIMSEINPAIQLDVNIPIERKN